MQVQLSSCEGNKNDWLIGSPRGDLSSVYQLEIVNQEGVFLSCIKEIQNKQMKTIFYIKFNVSKERRDRCFPGQT